MSWTQTQLCSPDLDIGFITCPSSCGGNIACQPSLSNLESYIRWCIRDCQILTQTAWTRLPAITLDLPRCGKIDTNRHVKESAGAVLSQYPICVHLLAVRHILPPSLSARMIPWEDSSLRRPVHIDTCVGVVIVLSSKDPSLWTDSISTECAGQGTVLRILWYVVN